MQTNHSRSVEPGVEAQICGLIDDAYAAARRGHIEALQLALTRFRALSGVEATELSEELYTIARCARAHPSFRPEAAPRQQAG